MNERVVIERTKRGYVVKSFDFTVNIYAVFEGPGSLKDAKMYCLENKLIVLNAAGHGQLPKQSRQEK
jgi:hypothetical protein